MIPVCRDQIQRDRDEETRLTEAQRNKELHSQLEVSILFRNSSPREVEKAIRYTTGKKVFGSSLIRAVVRITSLLTISTVAVAAPRARCRQPAPSLGILLMRISCHVSQIIFSTNLKWSLMSKTFGIFLGGPHQLTYSIKHVLATLSNSACKSPPDDPFHCQFIPLQALLQQGTVQNRRFNKNHQHTINNGPKSMDRRYWLFIPKFCQKR